MFFLSDVQGTWPAVCVWVWRAPLFYLGSVNPSSPLGPVVLSVVSYLIFCIIVSSIDAYPHTLNVSFPHKQLVREYRLSIGTIHWFHLIYLSVCLFVCLAVRLSIRLSDCFSFLQLLLRHWQRHPKSIFLKHFQVWYIEIEQWGLTYLDWNLWAES